MPVRDPRLGRGDADPERRRVRAGGRRDRRVGQGVRPRDGRRSRRWARRSAASSTAAASSSTTTGASSSASTFRLRESTTSGPLRYAELARKLDIAPGDSAPLADVRAAVLQLRRGKGMVIDPNDPDSVSAGSFFTNPILDTRAARSAGVARARRPREDLGGVADRAGGLPQGLRRRPRRHLHQAHARARQPRRRDDGGADGARARDRRRAWSSASASRCIPSRCSSATAGNRQRVASAPKPPRRIVLACPTTSNTRWSPP